MSPTMSLFAVALIGLAMYVVTWIFFRKPGESFAYVPIWRAHEFLDPVGTVLAVVGRWERQSRW